jgi:ribosomal protein S18 acetylase RimI-like enzyme
MTIREYGSTDYRVVCQCFIELQDMERALDGRLPAGASVADTYLRGLLERCQRLDGRIFVAEAEGRVVGYASVLPSCRENGPEVDATPYAYLDDLVVLPAHRGQGHGNALLRRTEAYATACGLSVLRLCVKGGNHSARAFYERAGFSEYELILERRIPQSSRT